MDFNLLVAGATAAVLTLFDLDRIFYVPTVAKQKAKLKIWWWSFILLNAMVAALLLVVFSDKEPLKSMPPWLRGLTAGLAYLAIIRAKFTTFTIQGRDVPFGFEALYEGAKSFVYRRINRIAKAARYDETIDLSDKHTLAELATRARLAIRQDALLSELEKDRLRAWLVGVLQDAQSDEFGKKSTIADFILSGIQS